MAQLTRFVLDPTGLGQVEHVANVVVDSIAFDVKEEAVRRVSGPGSPRPRSRQMLLHVTAQGGSGPKGHFVDVFSDATPADHGRVGRWSDYPYPSRLETGEDGHLYPWLRPALDTVFRRLQ